MCLICNYVNVDVKDYVNIEQYQCLIWNYMLMSKTCCNYLELYIYECEVMFVNVNMWLYMKFVCVCIYIYKICVFQ
jgi:hypothetical protein